MSEQFITATRLLPNKMFTELEREEVMINIRYIIITSPLKGELKWKHPVSQKKIAFPQMGGTRLEMQIGNKNLVVTVAENQNTIMERIAHAARLEQT